MDRIYHLEHKVKSQATWRALLEWRIYINGSNFTRIESFHIEIRKADFDAVLVRFHLYQNVCI